MIISASRRTDIPAFYTPWFMNRVRAGFVDAINPFNRKQVSRISLRPEDVDCIVFWTKNAAPMLPHLAELSAMYPFYFQFTITPYGHDVEPGLPDKREVIRTFQQMSQQLSKTRMVWRYDPILLNDHYTIERHLHDFAVMLEMLAPYTDRCVISFLDLYRKTERNTKLEGVALYIKSLEAEADAMKAEEKALAERRAVREKKAERLRRYLSDSMQALGDTKLETARVSLSFRKSEAVVIEDQAALPVEFLKVKMTETPDKAAIKNAIKAGAEVTGAALVENKNLQIK